MCDMMHVGDIMSTWGMFSTWGDARSTSRGYHEYNGGYHEYIGGYSVHQEDIMMYVGEQVDKSLSISIENLDVLMISPAVLMVSP